MTGTRMLDALEGASEETDVDAFAVSWLVLDWLADAWLPLDLICARLREQDVEIEPAELERVLLERGAAHRWVADEGTGNLTAEYRILP